MLANAFFVLISCYMHFVEGKTRIIGGGFSSIMYHPYIASLQVEDRHICGATIVKENVVISAAHCIRFSADAYKVRVGSSFWAKDGKLLSVTNVTNHPNYNPRTSNDNDISLVYLNESLVWSSTIRPITLPDENFQVFPSMFTTILGWGTTVIDDDNAVSPELKVVYLPIVNKTICIDVYPANSLTENMICAGSSYVEEDACSGDSGGPMVYNKTLIGIISWALGCADTTSPGIYTFVPKYVDFIKKAIFNDKNPCGSI